MKAWHRQGTQPQKEHLQSTQTTVNQQNSQTTQRAMWHHRKAGPRNACVLTANIAGQRRSAHGDHIQTVVIINSGKHTDGSLWPFTSSYTVLRNTLNGN